MTTNQTVQGFMTYSGDIVEGRRLILTAVIHASGAGLQVRNLHIIENTEKNEGTLRYSVEGSAIAIGILQDCFAAIGKR